MDCGVYYHEAQSGKSKRENRENNGHLVRKTFTPKKIFFAIKIKIKICLESRKGFSKTALRGRM